MAMLPSTTRAAAFLTAVGLLLVTPGVVVAQPATSTDAAEPGYATPPPLPPGTQPPNDTGKPDLTYQLKTECVKSLGQNIQLLYKSKGQDRLRITEAQKFATGKDVKVAVIDTGVHPHPYLGDRLSGGGDYVDQKRNGLEDCDGHGTEVAGIIAAKTPSKIGFKGVAPDATIVSIRQSSANYTGKPKATADDPDPKDVPAGNLTTLAMAIRRASDAGAKVINMSVDSCRPAGPITAPEQTLQAALRYAVDVKDVVLVSSAGNLNQNNCPSQNNGPDPQRPSTIVTPPWFADYVMSVAAVDENGDPADFSVQGPWVTVAAPGTDIISLDPATDGLANRTVINGQLSPIQGTSFAAPYVSGLAALVRQKYKTLNARQVMRRIEQTAQHPATPGGRDNVVGYGMIDPVAALTTYIPEEDGVAPAKAIKLPGGLPPAQEPDWAPMQVALLGTGGGIGLLFATMFVVHTVRRNKGPKPAHRT
ncbi:type VII secretion-associated serine protease mycosin [Labedaea rhizosphaerae]|uniref:Membrane-anchored mycosin MYCP n=1 Tax=Labedaea rhizosphaerae TaxID=598644 RepID=A0A4R6SQG4_LABRH|nr:membrane-anchored mycosin MYCP [Labedaea rhizosphaerae]